ncbi:hypothetical protein FACS189452_00810 [Bacteroidia bacterium]|nr:hypothetical protein FACS189452_00810 [Bacteroidia bacterium]GHT82729.1 hypothetical protein FACS189467_8140 [Bacteroidia bacterium]
MKKNLFLVLLPALIAAGCIGESESRLWKTDVVAVVVNEGNAAAKDGSINFYYEAYDSLLMNPIKNDAIQASIQSVAFTNGGALWFVCNNPDKIMVFDIETGNYSPTAIKDSLRNPRYLAIYSDSYSLSYNLFVTNKGAAAGDGSFPDSYVLVYDLVSNSTFAPTKRLSCGADAEGIVIVDGKIYVATGAGVKVFDVNNLANTPTTLAYTSTWGAAKQFVLDSLNNLWVSYSGGKVQYINTQRVEAVSNKDIPLDALSGNITLTRSGKHIISFVNEKDGAGADSVTIYRTDVTSGTASPIFTGKYNVRGINVNLFTGSIYVAAEQDGTSTLLLIKENGELLHRKATGIGTKQFRFFTMTYAL